jgi:hypothetical protein
LPGSHNLFRVRVTAAIIDDYELKTFSGEVDGDERVERGSQALRSPAGRHYDADGLHVRVGLSPRSNHGVLAGSDALRS